MIEIRSYKDEDYEEVKINLEDGGLFDESLDTKEVLKSKIKSNPDSILVAVVDKQIVGSVYLIQDLWSSFIFTLAVRKEFRERGIGSKLMEESERILKEKGIKDVALFVREGHKELIDYYQKRGYAPMSTLHHGMYKEL